MVSIELVRPVVEPLMSIVPLSLDTANCITLPLLAKLVLKKTQKSVSAVGVTTTVNDLVILVPSSSSEKCLLPLVELPNSILLVTIATPPDESNTVTVIPVTSVKLVEVVEKSDVIAALDWSVVAPPPPPPLLNAPTILQLPN